MLIPITRTEKCFRFIKFQSKSQSIAILTTAKPKTARPPKISIAAAATPIIM